MMKKMMALLLALMLLPLLPAFADGTAEDDHPFAVVRVYANQAMRVPLLAEANAAGERVGEVYSGAFVRVLEEKYGFLKVAVGQAPAAVMEGYIPAVNVDTTRGEMTVHTPVLTVRNTAGGTGITLRATPENSGYAYGVLRNGDEVVLLGISADQSWYLVQAGGITAYAARYGFSWYADTAVQETIEQPEADEEKQHAFYGPTGAYVTADWHIGSPDNMAVVNNPKPTERLHLREKPSYSSESLGRYYNGVRVEVLDKDDEWTHVLIGELEGYMRTEYLDFKSPWPQSGMPVMEIYNPGPLANMKLRLEPDMNAAYDGVYKNGTKVIMMGFTAEWAHVICDGKMGFMRTEFLK